MRTPSGATTSISGPRAPEPASTGTSGETCRLRLVESRTDLGGYTRYSLLCEGWTRPSGEIRGFGVRQGYQVDKLLTECNWEKSYATRLGGCGAVEPTTLGAGLPAVRRRRALIGPARRRGGRRRAGAAGWHSC